jgi:hypothetical protein
MNKYQKLNKAPYKTISTGLSLILLGVFGSMMLGVVFFVSGMVFSSL